MSSNGASTCKNTLNSDRERLRGFGGVEVRIPTAPTLENDGLTNSITYHDSFGHSSSIRRGKSISFETYNVHGLYIINAKIILF